MSNSPKMALVQVALAKFRVTGCPFPADQVTCNMEPTVTGANVILTKSADSATVLPIRVATAAVMKERYMSADFDPRKGE